jgi:hypothetical protein
VENLVNCQQLLFTGTEWHSNGIQTLVAIYAKTVEKNTIEPL